MIKAGNYCFRRRIRSFLRVKEEQFVQEMSAHFSQVSDYPLADGQIKAWRDTFRTLQSSLDSLPHAFDKLMIVFEYCLPLITKDGKEILKRSDVTIVSRDTVVILEFKQSSHYEYGASRQVRGYRKLYRKYHDQSKGMRMKCLTVFTDKKDYRHNEYRVIRCSGDTLPAILVELFGKKPEHLRRPEEKEWLHSSFSYLSDQDSVEIDN